MTAAASPRDDTGTAPAVAGSPRALAFVAERERVADAWQPHARTLRDLLSDPAVTAPPRWVLPPLVQCGEVALLSAPPKTGKSHLVSQLAADLSSGGHALDGTPLEPAAVLWLDVDEPVHRLARRLEALGADVDRFHIVQREPGRLLRAPHLAALIAAYCPALVVLDTTSQLALDAGVDANDGAQVGTFLRPLVDTVRAGGSVTPCAGLFIHHAPHHAPRAAGSLQWGAIVDADVVLRRRRRGVDLRADESDDDLSAGDDGARILEGVTRAVGPLKLRLTFAAGRYSVAAAPVPLIDRARALLTQLDCGPGISSASKLRDQLKCQDAALSEALDTLVRRGEAEAVGKPRSPQRHYVPTESMRQYVQGAVREEASGGGEYVGRSERDTRQKGGSVAVVTSSAPDGYTPAGGKKSASDSLRVVAVYGDDESEEAVW